MKIGYKLLIKENENVRSFNSNDPNSLFYKNYKVNEWNTPDQGLLSLGYGLLAFKSIQDALFFYGSMSGNCGPHQVVCHTIIFNTEDLINTSIYNCRSDVFTVDELSDFIQKLTPGDIISDYWAFPKGTINLKKLFLTDETIQL